MKRKNFTTVILLSILVLAGIVRVYRLDALSFWSVEAMIVSFAKHSLRDIADFALMYRPLYLFISKLWIYAFGTKEVVVRLLPAVLATLSVILMYKVGRSLWNRKTGLIAAFILSLSVVHVNFSREARGDFILMAGLVLMSFLTMLKILKYDKKRYYVYNMIVNALILFTNPYGIFWILTQNLCYFIFSREKNVKRWLLSMFAFSFVLVPWYIFVSSYSPERGITWFNIPTFSDIAQTYEAFSCGGSKIKQMGCGEEMSAQKMIIPRLLMVLYTILFLIELLSGNAQGRKSKLKIVLLCWLVFPGLLAYVYSFVGMPIYMYRYVLFSAPAYYLLIAHCLSRIGLKWRSSILAVILVLSLVSLNNIYTLAEGRKGFREGIPFLKSRINTGDIIVLSPAEMLTIFMYYYNYDEHEVLGAIDAEFGIKIDGDWKHDFVNKGNRIICIPFSKLANFSKNYDFEALNLHPPRGIWFVNSPEWPLNENSKFLDAFLKKRYSIKTEQLLCHDGIYITYFAVDNTEK